MHAFLRALNTSDRAAFSAAALAVAVAGSLVLGGCRSAGAGAAPVDYSSAASPRPGASIQELPGTLYYATDGKLVRLTTTGPRTILKGESASDAQVSPDGLHIAYPKGGALVVADADGGKPQRLHGGVDDQSNGGYLSVWSPDSSQLLIVDHTGPGIVSLANGTFTRLPKSLTGNFSYRWSGNGRELFLDADCTIKRAALDGGNLRAVPVIGDDDRSVNPEFTRACVMFGANVDGSRLAVIVHAGEEPDGDFGSEVGANVVLDTATGKPHRLPVSGEMVAALYRPDGSLLVRTVRGGRYTLTLLSPSEQVLVTVAEPASVKAMFLSAYTS